MERDYGREIDYLKEQLEGLQKLFADMTVKGNITGHKKVGHIEKMENMHPDEHIMACLDKMENIAGENGQTGIITYFGVFASGGRQSTWVRKDVNTDSLLHLISNNVAEKVLSCIDNYDRLNILLALLNSTGQAYHHMKPLLAADLIGEDSKGTYIVQPYKVQGIIMLLAGICDMVDETYSQSSWEPEEEQ